MVLVPSFGRDADQDLFVRAVAGVLALDHQVEIWPLAGPGRAAQRDGALLVDDLAAPEPSAMPGGTEQAWKTAAERLQVDPPDLLVLAGDLVVPRGELLEPDGPLGAGNGLRTAGLPLTGLRRPRCLPLWRRVGALLAIGRAEAATLAQAAGRPVDTIGTYLAINPFAVTEPPWFVPSEPFVALVDCSPTTDDGAASNLGEEMGGWLAAALDDDALVAIRGIDALRWPRGRQTSAPAVVSRSDLWRVLAHARAVVPVGAELGTARCALESLLLGTPVLASPGTLAGDLAVESRGGLAVDADWRLVHACRWLLEHPETASAAGACGRRWATRHVGNPEAFVDRVRHALGLRSNAGPPEPATRAR
ncbi:glycosyltransferase [Aciditerrimonas ferrireducens]|uniref:Glycosyltransferase n=1 Tax=Aciditerrimonas ferrireducens TaxID=667306 RepID=A0ABV6C152_9ACTN